MRIRAATGGAFTGPSVVGVSERPTAATPAEADLGFAPEDRRIGRRVFLGLAGLGAAGIVWGARLQSGLSDLVEPLARRDPTGLSELVPTAGRFRIYSVTGSLPSRSPEEYRLRVEGLVRRPRTLDLSDLRAGLPQRDLTRDFQCVTGWRVGDVDWAGVTVSDVLDAAGGLADGVTHVRFWSFDGTYTETLTLSQAIRPDVLVAHGMQGGDVSREHGGPVRLYVAPMYGYKSLKWLERIEAVRELDAPTDPGYWEQRGYDSDAWVGASNGLDDDPTS